MDRNASEDMDKMLSDSKELKKEMQELEKVALSAFNTVVTGLGEAIIQGQSFESTLLDIGKSLLDIAGQEVGSSLADGISGIMKGVLQSGNSGQAASQDGFGGLFSAISSAGGQYAASQPVQVTIQANDVNSFKQSEQYISQLMARTVARGQRGL